VSPLITGGIVTLLTRTLLLVAAGTLTLAAQPLITVRPEPDQVPPGIAIRTPSDPSFQSLAEKLLVPAAVPLYQHILPYSTVIRNETPTPVIAMVLSIQITDATGRTSKPMMGHFGSTPPGKKEVVLAPGRDMLLTPDPRFTQLAPILSAFNEAKQKQRLDELANHPLEPYISARAITLALDSVLFADGTVEGPDEENAFETWTNALHIEATFEGSVLAFQGRDTEELRQYLATEAATGPRQAHSWGLPDMRLRAQGYERILRDKGPERVFTIVKDNLKQATELTIHR
jgi:hypothetical protein